MKGANDANIATATMFETGSNRWRHFDVWPPKDTSQKTLFLAGKEKLVENANNTGSSEYVSDPNKPVPHSAKISRGWDRPYMVEDQRFAARRPDVLVFETEILENDLTIAGAIDLNLWFSTNKSAADVVVKLVDVFPSVDDNVNKADMEKGNRHELVRWGVLRGRFRESMSKPKAFFLISPRKLALNFTMYYIHSNEDISYKFKYKVACFRFLI